VRFRSAYNENAELDNAGVEPGAVGFGFYLPALKIGLQENLSKQEPAIPVLVFIELGFSLFGGRQCTPNGQFF